MKVKYANRVTEFVKNSAPLVNEYTQMSKCAVKTEPIQTELDVRNPVVIATRAGLPTPIKFKVSKRPLIQSDSNDVNYYLQLTALTLNDMAGVMGHPPPYFDGEFNIGVDPLPLSAVPTIEYDTQANYWVSSAAPSPCTLHYPRELLYCEIVIPEINGIVYFKVL